MTRFDTFSVWMICYELLAAGDVARRASLAPQADRFGRKTAGMPIDSRFGRI